MSVPHISSAACSGNMCDTQQEALDRADDPQSVCPHLCVSGSPGCASYYLKTETIGNAVYYYVTYSSGYTEPGHCGVVTFGANCSVSAPCCGAPVASGCQQCPSGDCGNKCQNSTQMGSSANLKSGNYYYEQTVITAPERLAFTLRFNNKNTSVGPFGRGWTHPFNMRIYPYTLPVTKKLLLRTSDGNNVIFTANGTTYYPDAGSGDTSTIAWYPGGTRTTKEGFAQTFDSSGKLTGIIDRNGNQTYLYYSGNDITGIYDVFSGRILRIANSNGKISTMTDPAGKVYTFTYSGDFLTAITDPAGNAWHYAYDASGNMISKTDPMGFTTTYTYDGGGRLLSATDPNGNVKTIAYESNNSTQYVEKDGGLWTHEYDPDLNLPTAKTDPQGNITRYTYDDKGNMLSRTNPDGSVTAYTYDANSNEASMTDALGQTTTYTNNNFGQVTSITDPRGSVFTYVYDAKGNLTSVADALGAITRYQYDAKGRMTIATNALNRTTTFGYDSYGNIVSITDPKGAITRFAYDLNGNMTSWTDANSKVTTFTYNNINQLTKITDPKGNMTIFTYDKNGNLATQTDANGNATYYEYNYKRRLVQVKDALNGITSLVYGSTGCTSCGGGGADKLTALMDANGNTTTTEYNLLGHRTRSTDPLGKVTTYSYDASGNLVSRTDANNNTTTFSYDSVGRLVTKTYPDNTTATFTYDANGNILSAANAAISYSYAYDNNNRLLTVTDSSYNVVRYAYDAAGNRTMLTYPDNSTLTYTYDTANRLSTIVDGAVRTYTFTYDSLDRRTKLTYPSAAYNTYAYDEISRLTGITTRLGTYTYQYDKIMNRTSLTEPQGTHNYTYDKVYELLIATHSTQPNEQYAYDLVGNRAGAATNGANQILSDGAYAYSYDNIGNLLSRTTVSTGEVRTFAWDYENRLIAVIGTGLDARYAYDPFGRRVQKNVNNTITNYIYDGPVIIAEYDGNNQLVTRYAQGPGMDEHLSVQRGGTVWYYHTDGLGSVTAMTDSAGTVVQTYSYDSFGKIVGQAGGIVQPYTYTGREYDAETGLYYYRARYYDARAGRFISKDPIGFDGGDTNLYAYVGNNPVNFIDPLGLFYFGKRPLSGSPWLGAASSNPIDDYFNTELSHEHGFFEDVQGDNVGFGPNGRFSEDPTGKGYRYDNTHYDDALMRQALNNINDGTYSNWPWNKNNCQDWAERLRKEYERLKKEREKCK